MNLTVFDIETTGLNRGIDSIIQIAFINITDDARPTSGRVYHLYKEGMRWSAEAEAVHGISRAYLEQFKDEYETNLLRVYATMQRANLVGHNSDNFDVPFTSNFLAREGLPGLQPGWCFDTMRLWQQVYGKAMKLSALTERLGITPTQIRISSKLVFGADTTAHHNHDAGYDTMATLLCFRKAIERGLVNLAPGGQCV